MNVWMIIQFCLIVGAALLGGGLSSAMAQNAERDILQVINDVNEATADEGEGAQDSNASPAEPEELTLEDVQKENEKQIRRLLNPSFEGELGQFIRNSPHSPQSSGVRPSEIRPIFLTDWEYDALRDAIAQRGRERFVNAPTQEEVDEDIRKEVTNIPEQGQGNRPPGSSFDPFNPDFGTQEVVNRPPPPPEERYITLHGIAFTNKNDWTIWLNGERVSPKAIPKEIISLEVYDNYIEMRWFDDYTRQIYPLRLRSNQRFNLDTRIFLPG